MVRKEKKGIKEKKKEEKEIVCVDINDILEFAKKNITERYGGIGYTDVEYVDDVDKLKFTIPKLDRKGKCNETEYFESEKCGKDGGCGGTGGACICGKPKGHTDDHECEFCGADW